MFVLAFAASEVAYPLLFPWTYAATVHQLPVLMQLAELGGPILVAVVLIAANLLVAEPIAALARVEAASTPVPRRRAPGGRPGKRLAPVAPACPARSHPDRRPDLRRVSHPPGGCGHARGRARLVGMVQANMGLMEKRQNRAEGLRRHLALTRELTHKSKLDLVVWSETSVMGAMEESESQLIVEEVFTAGWDRLPSSGPCSGAKSATRAATSTSTRRCSRTRRGTSAMAAATTSSTCWRLASTCRSVTVPHALPMVAELGQFTPGTSLRPLPLGPHELATFICYEDIIPAFVNEIVAHGHPDLLVNMTNDAWFGDSTEPWIHLALSKFRAIEHRRYLVRSTNSGVSGVIDPVGRVVVHGGTFREEALLANIAWLRAATPFEVLGNAPWWLVAVLVFAAGFVSAPGSRAGKPAPKAPLARLTSRGKACEYASSALSSIGRAGPLPLPCQESAWCGVHLTSLLSRG